MNGEVDAVDGVDGEILLAFGVHDRHTVLQYLDLQVLQHGQSSPVVGGIRFRQHDDGLVIGHRRYYRGVRGCRSQYLIGDGGKAVEVGSLHPGQKVGIIINIGDEKLHLLPHWPGCGGVSDHNDIAIMH